MTSVSCWFLQRAPGCRPSREHCSVNFKWAKAHIETWLAPIGCAPKDLHHLWLLASLFCCSFYAMDIPKKQTKQLLAHGDRKGAPEKSTIRSCQSKTLQQVWPFRPREALSHPSHAATLSGLKACHWVLEVHTSPFKFTPISVQLESRRCSFVACFLARGAMAAMGFLAWT